MKDLNKKMQKHPNKKQSLLALQIQVLKQFELSYVSDELIFGKRIINNIIYNEKSHCVALFKDFLILDDNTEFLKRYYSKIEAEERLPRFFKYYETYSKIFPNYTSLFEGKYIYRNIQKKQKMIDLQERMELEMNKKKDKHSATSDEVFSTDVYDSIINDRNNEDLETIFNLNEHSIDFYDKIGNIISDIEKTDTNNRNLSHNNRKNISSNSNSNQNILTPSSNSKNDSSSLKNTKHKFLISSFLGRNKYINVNNKNGFIRTKDKPPIFISYHNSCDSIGEDKLFNSKIPLTDRLRLKNKPSENQSSNTNANSNTIVLNGRNCNKEKNQRQFSKTKLLSSYPKTIVIDNSTIQKLKGKEDLSTPLTQRENYKFKYNELTLTQLKEFNEKKRKGNKIYIKTPPKFGNNFTYIVNPHSKITTHVTLSNNNNSSLTSTKNTVNTQQLSGRTNSNVQSKVSSKRPSATFQNKNNQPTNETMNGHGNGNVNVECLTGRTRNTKLIINNNLMIKTSRDLNNKNINLLRTTSQPSIPPLNAKDKFYTTKYSMKQNNKSRPSSTHRKRSASVCHNHHPNKINIPLANRNDSMKTKLDPKINQSNNNNHPKKQLQLVKGIHINNFSKVFTINCSQAVSDRLDRKSNCR